MTKPEPAETSIWIDAVIAAGFDPRDLPDGMDDLCKRVFDFGADVGRLNSEARIDHFNKP